MKRKPWLRASKTEQPLDLLISDVLLREAYGDANCHKNRGPIPPNADSVDQRLLVVEDVAWRTSSTL
jgi:hypothetical protein